MELQHNQHEETINKIVNVLSNKFPEILNEIDERLTKLENTPTNNFSPTDMISKEFSRKPYN